MMIMIEPSSSYTRWMHSTVWGRKFEAIMEFEKYDTLTMNGLFLMLNSARWIGA
jgi:hypothetical protein